ncbi:predicted protein [Plenodomus lingam JN3]|uniref:Predicted protein n=1 Tax=Leptosphaeria maculans (strain JN3 / isolate v23.1.3 / race Av1-4-5-6-7-8) TaxID=985895 RepID=E4ZYF7_LEPMJ|nr:predicted protein [Plenodomus lingam JN3]CBX96483.1 predicted protein [Plenodomus lingam JN3]
MAADMQDQDNALPAAKQECAPKRAEYNEESGVPKQREPGKAKQSKAKQSKAHDHIA